MAYLTSLAVYISVPSQPPTAFKLTTSSSTSIKASWQLPPVFARHGRNITGFKLFYKKKGSGQSFTTSTICSGATLSRNVTGLKEYTEYEFQVLAYTSDGVGPKSPVEVERTKEDGKWKIEKNTRLCRNIYLFYRVLLFYPSYFVNFSVLCYHVCKHVCLRTIIVFFLNRRISLKQCPY